MKVDDEEMQKKKRLEKKRRLKERFNAEYDDGDATYFDDLKEEMQKQAEVPRQFKLSVETVPQGSVIKAFAL